MTPCVWLLLRKTRNPSQMLEIGTVTSKRVGVYEIEPHPGTRGDYKWVPVSATKAAALVCREESDPTHPDAVSVMDEFGTVRTMKQARDRRIARA